MRSTLPVVFPAILLLSPAAPSGGPARGEAPERRFSFVYETAVADPPDGAGRIDLWIPIPSSDPFQEVSNLEVKATRPYRLTTAPPYGNRMVHIGVEGDPEPLEVTVRFDVRRREQTPAPDVVDASLRGRFLDSDRLVPVTGRAREIAAAVASGATDSRGKARAIYEHVLGTMRYDKSGTGWGRGDFDYACDAKAGNCTDFHSLFIGVARAARIPAVFEIGFPIPTDRKEGEIGGYHCWAVFEDPDRGWTPTDISEAWKNPTLRDYYFGRLTPDRVVLSRGRDLRLEPPQEGEPLNFFVYPYCEVDGKPFEGVAKRFSFRDIAE
jgi:transglutaminase-like putative cysteine protease